MKASQKNPGRPGQDYSQNFIHPLQAISAVDL